MSSTTASTAASTIKRKNVTQQQTQLPYSQVLANNNQGSSLKKSRSNDMIQGPSSPAPTTPHLHHQRTSPTMNKLLSPILQHAPPAHPKYSPNNNSVTPQQGLGSPIRRRTLSPQPKKKMVIKPFKNAPTPPADFESSTLTKLRTAVTTIFSYDAANDSAASGGRSNGGIHSQEELYRSVESLCQHKRAALLYTQLYEQCTAHIQSVIQQLATIYSTADDLTFVNQVEQSWLTFTRQLTIIRSIYLYLDRTYVIQSAVGSLWQMSLTLWKTFMHDNEQYKVQVEDRTLRILLQMIENERNGELINTTQLKLLLRMFSQLKLYSAYFQPLLIEQTTRYYQSEADKLVAELNTTDYLHHCNKRLTEELHRCTTYLDTPISRQPLIHTVEQQLIAHHLNDILSKGFELLMKAKAYTDLELLYNLFARVHAIEQLRNAFSVYITKHGSDIVQLGATDPAKDQQMVPSLLTLKEQLDEILKKSYQSNVEYNNTMRIAFEQVINSRENKPAEWIAKYIDRLLRTGSKQGITTTDELYAAFDALMYFFRLISGKDMFMAFYKTHLARRLLLNKSASVDNERMMISMLKQECGNTFTSKLEGMFKDIELCKDLNLEFGKHLAAIPNMPADLDTSVQVLTTGNWPQYNPITIKLPSEINAVQQEFLAFYQHKHGGRKIVWQNSLATAILRFNGLQGKRELVVTGFQATVLMLFNDTDSTKSLTYKQILDMSQLDEKELRLTLYSLSMDPTNPRILRKTPDNRKMIETDVFAVDMQFKHKLYRLTINAIQMKESKEESSATSSKVFEDRQYAVDAALVRIMKSRKTLLHNQLIAECVSQLKFPVKMADIKKRIASLIEREYIERDPDNASLYIYQA